MFDFVKDLFSKGFNDKNFPTPHICNSWISPKFNCGIRNGAVRVGDHLAPLICLTASVMCGRAIINNIPQLFTISHPSRVRGARRDAIVSLQTIYELSDSSGRCAVISHGNLWSFKMERVNEWCTRQKTKQPSYWTWSHFFINKTLAAKKPLF